MDAEETAKAAFEAYVGSSGASADVRWETVPEVTRQRWRSMTSKMLSRGTRV